MCRGMRFRLCRDNHSCWTWFRFLMDGISHRETHWTSFGHLFLTPLASHCLCHVGSVLWPVWGELCGQESGHAGTVCSELQGRAVGSWEEERGLGESTWSWVLPHQGIWGPGGHVLGHPSPKTSRILPSGCCCHLLFGRIYAQAGLLSIGEASQGAGGVTLPGAGHDLWSSWQGGGLVKDWTWWSWSLFQPEWLCVWPWLCRWALLSGFEPDISFSALFFPTWK